MSSLEGGNMNGDKPEKGRFEKFIDKNLPGLSRDDEVNPPKVGDRAARAIKAWLQPDRQEITAPESSRHDRVLGEEERAQNEESWRQASQILDALPPSRFNTVVENGRTFLESKEGTRYEISKLNEQPRESFEQMGNDVREFYKKFMDEGLVDEAQNFKVQLEENYSNFYAVRDASGNIVAMLNTQHLTTEMGPDKAPNLSLMGWYVAVDEAHRTKGFDIELYRKAGTDFVEQARRENKRAHSILGEISEEAHQYSNRLLGVRRAYFEHADGTVEQVPYVYFPPSCEENYSTQKEGVEAGHIMMRRIDGRNDMSVQEYRQILGSIVNEFEPEMKPRYFEEDSAKGKANYERMIGETYEWMSGKLMTQAKGQRIFFMTPEERDQKKAELERSGKQLIEIVEKE